jgi:recombination endonuclease VII
VAQGGLSAATKRCPKCGEDKLLVAFGVRKRSPSGRKSWCRACESLRQQERHRERTAVGLCRECGRAPRAEPALFCVGCLDRQAAKRVTRRQSGLCAACGAHAIEGRSRCHACLANARVTHLRSRAGLSQADYVGMLASQQGCCAICREACRTGRRLAVDHDHSSGRIRGLLCFRCNTSLARYEQYAQQLADYLAGDKIKVDVTP